MCLGSRCSFQCEPKRHARLFTSHWLCRCHFSQCYAQSTKSIHSFVYFVHPSHLLTSFLSFLLSQSLSGRILIPSLAVSYDKCGHPTPHANCVLVHMWDCRAQPTNNFASIRKLGFELTANCGFCRCCCIARFWQKSSGLVPLIRLLWK